MTSRVEVRALAPPTAPAQSSDPFGQLFLKYGLPCLAGMVILIYGAAPLRHSNAVRTIESAGGQYAPVAGTAGYCVVVHQTKWDNDSNNCLADLATNPPVLQIDLSWTTINDDGLGVLARFRDLEDLNLSHTLIGGNDLQPLASLPSLRRLNLAFTYLGNDYLDQLRQFTRLERLDLSWTSVDKSAYRTLLVALPQTEIVIHPAQLIENDALRELNVPAEFNEQLEITSLEPRGYVLGTWQFLAITELPQLERLDLTNNPINDNQLRFLTRSKQLRSLTLDGTSLSDTGVAWCRSMTQLEELRLRSTRVTDTGILHLACLPRLQVLDVAGTHITDRSLDHFARLPELQELNLERTRVTAAAVEQLRLDRPDLTVFD